MLSKLILYMNFCTLNLASKVGKISQKDSKSLEVYSLIKKLSFSNYFLNFINKLN
jgi:hypothetical protein